MPDSIGDSPFSSSFSAAASAISSRNRDESDMQSKNSASDRGKMPGSSATPMMECVFPEPMKNFHRKTNAEHSRERLQRNQHAWNTKSGEHTNCVTSRTRAEAPRFRSVLHSSDLHISGDWTEARRISRATRRLSRGARTSLSVCKHTTVDALEGVQDDVPRDIGKHRVILSCGNEEDGKGRERIFVQYRDY